GVDRDGCRNRVGDVAGYCPRLASPMEPRTSSGRNPGRPRRRRSAILKPPTMISPARKPLLGRRLFSLTCFVEALLLVGLLVLLSQALRPDFGGGKFVLVTLFASIGLLLIATIRDVVTAIIADRNIVV